MNSYGLTPGRRAGNRQPALLEPRQGRGGFVSHATGSPLRVQNDPESFTPPRFPFQPLPTPRGAPPYRFDLGQLLAADDVLGLRARRALQREGRVDGQVLGSTAGGASAPATGRVVAATGANADSEARHQASPNCNASYAQGPSSRDLVLDTGRQVPTVTQRSFTGQAFREVRTAASATYQ